MKSGSSVVNAAASRVPGGGLVAFARFAGSSAWRCGLGGLLCVVLALASAGVAAGAPVEIRADFPGGNVQVESMEGDTVHLAPDLRGGRPWFYWHFEARAARAGKVTFSFANPPMVGVRGPAVSRDGGATWQWLGVDAVTYAPAPGEKDPAAAARRDAFVYEFTEPNQAVRFAVAIPYVSSNLDAFLARHAGSGRLASSVLTRSNGGRDVRLLQVGPTDGATPGAAMLVTARSHACETMASYVLEGFLAEAISDSPAAVEFRKRYVLYCVPIIDVDGVEAGDQGKNRLPHDHNRDYGATQIYPEIAAIQQLAKEKQVRYALDLHCPALRGDVHEAFYFDGFKLPHITANLTELTNWIREERPPIVMAPLDFTKKPPAETPVENMPFSHYFAIHVDTHFAATLEIPYTQPNVPLDADMARRYGASLLRAWSRTAFAAKDAIGDDVRGDAAHAKLVALRTTFQQTFRRDPQQTEETLRALRDDAAASPAIRAEAQFLTGQLRASQKQFDEAQRFFDAVIADPQATTHQRASALVEKTVAVAAASTAPEPVDAAVGAFEAFGDASAEQRAKVYQAVMTFHQARQDYARALSFAQQRASVASQYERGRTLNQVAAIYDLLKQPDQAIATRREAVRILRGQLNPVPVGGMGPAMAADLFDALCALPDATTEEKRAAAQIVLDHAVASVALKDRVRQAMTERGIQ